MKIVCAPDSFKGRLTAIEAARAMARGIRVAAADTAVDIDECPVGDGGEGTMDVLLAAIGGSTQSANVTGPLDSQVDARFGLISDGKTAFVELAEASGLSLVPSDRRDPAQTTTFGTGELMQAAIRAGCREIIVCIGGSATVDGGTGIAQALGARFFDTSGREIETPITGSMLDRIARFISPQSLPKIRVACDVTNPLWGPNGAAAVYGPQKGATPAQVRDLDVGLAHLARVIGGDPKVPGAGAAGGAGFGLMAMCGAMLERGIDLVLDAVDFDARCRGASLVLTGEGRLDRESLHGKACMGVARAAAQLGIPTVAIVGSTAASADECLLVNGGWLQRYINLSERFGESRAMSDPRSCISQIASELIDQLK